MSGNKALIFCPRPAVSAVDNAIWSHDVDSWLPHGVDEAPGAQYAVAWISTDLCSNPIGAKFLFVLHGSFPLSISDFDRCFYLFDGKSETQLAQARLQWKEWDKSKKNSLGYFTQQNDGVWKKVLA